MVRAIMKSMLNVFPFSLHNVMLLIIILNCSLTFSLSLSILCFNFSSFFLSFLSWWELLEGSYGYIHLHTSTFCLYYIYLCFTGVTILLSLTVFLNMVAETMVSALIWIQGVDACYKHSSTPDVLELQYWSWSFL